MPVWPQFAFANDLFLEKKFVCSTIYFASRIVVSEWHVTYSATDICKFYLLDECPFGPLVSPLLSHETLVTVKGWPLWTWVKSSSAYGMLSYLRDCRWNASGKTFSQVTDYALVVRGVIWGVGEKKPVRAARTVFVLMCYFTASVWGPGGTFSGMNSGVERTRALMTDRSGFDSGSFKDAVTLVQCELN